MWFVAGPVVLLIVVGILVWRRASSADQWNTSLAGDQHTGAEIFQKKRCISCHAIRGEGGTVGPDLSSDRPLPRTLTQMARRLWNHSPEMWATMKAKGIERSLIHVREAVYEGNLSSPNSKSSIRDIPIGSSL